MAQSVTVGSIETEGDSNVELEWENAKSSEGEDQENPK